jgi:hypothetical protein
MNRQLEDVLHRLGLRLGGSKNDRIERIINHFAGAIVPPTDALAANAVPSDQAREATLIDSQVLANQGLFRQRASNPQASLQPWLEQLLDGIGQVRCYATEDANPTKQLKNKLSQAAAASGGLLVLMLADEGSFAKARQALIERWMANAEWPKSVACVALAYPLSGPTIEAIIERAASPWAPRLRARLFPLAEVISVRDDRDQPAALVTARCSRCEHALPVSAKFCPNCGKEVDPPGRAGDE